MNIKQVLITVAAIAVPFVLFGILFWRESDETKARLAEVVGEKYGEMIE